MSRGPVSRSRPASSSAPTRSTRAFSVTTCRTHAACDRIVEPGQCRVQVLVREVAQRRQAQAGGRPVAGGEAFGVGAVGQVVLDAGVDDQEAQARGGAVEGDGVVCGASGVQAQDVALGGAGGGRLVHDPAGHAHVRVLGAAGQGGQFGAGGREPVQLGEGQGGRHLQGGGGGQSCSGRHVGAYVEVRAADREPRLAQRPGHPGRVRGPAVGSPRPVCRVEGGEVEGDHPGAGRGGVEPQQAVGARGGGHFGALREGEGQGEAVVVVGVFADQVDPAGAAHTPYGRCPYRSRNARAVSFTGSPPRAGARPRPRAGCRS